MYGVVLWSDRLKNCAVIWCEDHRKLAYFSHDKDAPSAQGFLTVGDLVEFDVREENDMRLALTPVVVAERHHALLGDELLRSAEPKDSPSGAETSLPGEDRGISHVLPFPDLMSASGKMSSVTKDAAKGVTKDTDRKYG